MWNSFLFYGFILSLLFYCYWQQSDCHCLQCSCNKSLTFSWACDHERGKKAFAVSLIAGSGGSPGSVLVARALFIAVAVCSCAMEDSSVIHSDIGHRDVREDGILWIDMQYVYVPQFQPDVLGIIQRGHSNFCIQRHSVCHGRFWRLVSRLVPRQVSYNRHLLLHLRCWFRVLAAVLSTSTHESWRKPGSSVLVSCEVQQQCIWHYSSIR